MQLVTFKNVINKCLNYFNRISNTLVCKILYNKIIVNLVINLLDSPQFNHYTRSMTKMHGKTIKRITAMITKQNTPLNMARIT